MYSCLKTRSSVNARGRQDALQACSAGISQENGEEKIKAEVRIIFSRMFFF